jgi:pyruvate/2-oxoglutarate dehydrogenase complex dihydrolipoamide dehydrogenase (E3) component
MKCEIESFVASESDPKRVGSVKLKDGTVLPCVSVHYTPGCDLLTYLASVCSQDAVILGIGAKPNTELLKAAGVEIEKDGGIKVDEHLRIVGHSDVYAVGES